MSEVAATTVSRRHSRPGKNTKPKTVAHEPVYLQDATACHIVLLMEASYWRDA